MTARRDHEHPAFYARNGLSHDERQARTRDLFEVVAQTGDTTARDRALDEIVEINARVARSIANRFAGRGVDVEDLEQTACEALIKAAHRFDPAQKRDFLSYAVPTVRGEVQRYFRDKSWTIRPRRTIQESQGRLNRFIRDFVAEHDREPSQTETCEALGWSRDLYVETVNAFGFFQPTSLNFSVAQERGALELGDLIPDTRDEQSPVEAAIILRPLLEELPDADRRVLHLRFFEDKSQREIGADLGVGQAQTSRNLERIFADLRARIGDLHGEAVPA